MLILEGLRSGVLSCSLVLVVPAIGLVVLRRARALSTLIAIWLGVSAGAWSRFAGIWSLDAAGMAKVLLIFGITLVLLSALSDRAHPGWSHWSELPAFGGPLLLGLGVSAYWEPCVGEHFAGVLNGLDQRSPGDFTALALYVLAVLTPASIVAAAVFVVRRS
jgi:cytochrome c biogenesis protein CcdA